MKRGALTHIVAAARAAGIPVTVRQGSRHEIWRVGQVQVAFPRHREIGLKLAQAIRHHLEAALGENWWR